MKRLKLWRRLLEYLGILRVNIDIGNEEIRIIEIIRFLFFFRVISIKRERVYDSGRLSFVLERFLEKNTTHKIRRVNLTLSSTSIIPLFLTFPGIPKEKIESAILWEIERNIPLPIEEAYFTHKIVSQVFENGTNVWNILAVIAKKQEVDKYISTFKDLGIIVEDISYLPINILSALDFGNSENSIGYVYITEHAIELYVIFKKRIISFAHYIGDFNGINQVTIRNITDYFAAFIQRRVSFLERIIVINQTSGNAQLISETLLDSLNILTMPATPDDYMPIFKKSKIDSHIYDLLGFTYKSYLNLKISSEKIRKLHVRDVLLRISVVILMILNILSLSFFPLILAANTRFRIVQKARTTPLSQVKDPQVKKMIKTLHNIETISKLKTRQRDLLRKINEVKNSGIESSTVKLVLAEFARLIPEDVWLNSLSLGNGRGEITGYAASTDGLERFISYLVNSKIITSVVLKKADLTERKKSMSVKFIIGFGAKK